MADLLGRISFQFRALQRVDIIQLYWAGFLSEAHGLKFLSIMEVNWNETVHFWGWNQSLLNNFCITSPIYFDLTGYFRQQH